MSEVIKYVPTQDQILYNRRKVNKWREENLQQRKEYEKEYYENNRKAIKAKALEKVICDLCGSIVCRQFIAKHKRTIKCKAIIEQNNSETYMNLLSGLGWLGSA